MCRWHLRPGGLADRSHCSSLSRCIFPSSTCSSTSTHPLFLVFRRICIRFHTSKHPIAHINCLVFSSNSGTLILILDTTTTSRQRLSSNNHSQQELNRTAAALLDIPVYTSRPIPPQKVLAHLPLPLPHALSMRGHRPAWPTPLRVRLFVPYHSHPTPTLWPHQSLPGIYFKPLHSAAARQTTA